MTRIVLLSLTVFSVAGCSTGQIIDNTASAVGGTAKVAGRAAVGATKIAVRGAVGAGRLAAKGTVAGVRELREARSGFEAGDTVCVNEDGDIIGRIEDVDGTPTCFLDEALIEAAAADV